jgi:hypothetical protein
MTFFDRLRPASFRGVPFRVSDHAVEGGRRIASTEYPLRDTPYHEDLGLRMRGFTVEAYVIGARWIEERDALMRACEQEGPGELVHPFLGARNVVCPSYRLRESTAELGVARLALFFADAGENRFPAAALDTQADVQAKADRAGQALRQSFARRWDVAGQDFLEQDGKAQLDALARRMGALRLGNGSAQALLQAAGQQGLAADLRDGDGLAAGVLRLMTVGGGLVSNGKSVAASSPLAAVFSLLGLGNLGAAIGQARAYVGTGSTSTALPVAAAGAALVSGAPDLVAARGLLTQTDGFPEEFPAVPETTPTRQRQARNRAAFDDLVRGGAAVETARVGAGLDFPTWDDAIAWRDDVTARLGDRMMSADDDVFPRLADLRAAVARDVNTRAVDLPRLRTLRPPVTMPALALAHSLYEDPAREAEIVTRNRIRHPGFVPGGAELRVLAEERA